MGILAARADERIKDVKFTDDSLCVELMDGRTGKRPKLGRLQGCVILKISASSVRPEQFSS